MQGDQLAAVAGADPAQDQVGVGPGVPGGRARLPAFTGRAEEAAQETFAAVWRSARSYKPERGSASAWLYAVARHAIIDRARQRREQAADVPEEASPSAGPDEQAEESWLAWRVHSALEQLPERERVVVELAYWSGLSQTEIASYLDVPLGTVKTRTRTGLARLAGLLDEVRQ